MSARLHRAARPCSDRPPVAAPNVGWFLLPMGDVPEEWASRIRPMALVPLLPAESAELLADGPHLADDEIRFRRLVAEGKSRAQMAKCLNISLTTVDRRLRRLLGDLGCASRAEAVGVLARKGF